MAFPLVRVRNLSNSLRTLNLGDGRCLHFAPKGKDGSLQPPPHLPALEERLLGAEFEAGRRARVFERVPA